MQVGLRKSWEVSALGEALKAYGVRKGPAESGALLGHERQIIEAKEGQKSVMLGTKATESCTIMSKSQRAERWRRPARDGELWERANN